MVVFQSLWVNSVIEKGEKDISEKEDSRFEGLELRGNLKHWRNCKELSMTVGSGSSKKGWSWQGVEAEGIDVLSEFKLYLGGKGEGTERFKGGEL